MIHNRMVELRFLPEAVVSIPCYLYSSPEPSDLHNQSLCPHFGQDIFSFQFLNIKPHSPFGPQMLAFPSLGSRLPPWRTWLSQDAEQGRSLHFTDVGCMSYPGPSCLWSPSRWEGESVCQSTGQTDRTPICWGMVFVLLC